MSSLLESIAHHLGSTVEECQAAMAADPILSAWGESHESAYRKFVPRADRPEMFDEQAGFVGSKDTVAFLLAGNASGKTSAAANKCANFLLREQPPPRKDTPFWILSDTMDVVTSICWGEKLMGEGHIPRVEVDWDRITWHNQKEGQPKSVPLLPWPKHKGGHPEKNWKIEFKSYDQGRRALQGRGIGGFWFSEQFPVGIFTEVMVRCRQYLFPGGQFAEFTPLEPELCIWLEKVLEDCPPKWGFYRCNTECNRENLADGAIESFMATVPDELIETRMRGALASFSGTIYTNFAVPVHVLPNSEMSRFPPGVCHALGTDWGASVEHPQVTIFGCMDGIGDWWIYDEYWSTDQRTLFEHAQKVVEKAKAWGWPIRERFCEPIGRPIDTIVPGINYGLNFCDPSRPGNINEWTQYGVPSGPAVNDVYDGINEIRRLLKVNDVTGKPKIFIAKRCSHLIEEMRKYRWRRAKRAIEGNLLNPAAAKPEPLKRDDDCVDAMRYLIKTYGRFRSGQSPVSSISRPPPDALHTRTSGSVNKLVPGLFFKPKR